MPLNMKFPSAILACFLFVYFSHSSASVIPNGNIADQGIWPEEYFLHVTERGTKFTETIVVDEEKDLEYFHVPAHNQVTEAADYLYDFKTNMALQRIESKGTCYLGPLPKNLPNPTNLKTVLRKVSRVPPSQNDDEAIVQNYWTIADQVDKTILREEAQKFCNDFPIYRLQKVELNSTNSHGDGGRTRIARDPPPSVSRFPPFCKQEFPTGCNPQDWLYDYKIRGKTCTWWLTCNFDVNDMDIDCGTLRNWDHQFNSIICYIPRCP